MPAAIGIVFSDASKKSILLIKRRDVPVWALPGGGIENKESPEHACCREVFEETGLNVQIEHKLGTYEPKNALTDTSHVYICNGANGELKTGTETKDVKYFPIDDLPKMLPPPHGAWISRALKGKKEELDYVPNASYPLLIKTALRHPIVILRFFFSRIGLHINT